MVGRGSGCVQSGSADWFVLFLYSSFLLVFLIFTTGSTFGCFFFIVHFLGVEIWKKSGVYNFFPANTVPNFQKLDQQIYMN